MADTVIAFHGRRGSGGPLLKEGATGLKHTRTANAVAYRTPIADARKGPGIGLSGRGNAGEGKSFATSKMFRRDIGANVRSGGR